MLINGEIPCSFMRAFCAIGRITDEFEIKTSKYDKLSDSLFAQYKLKNGFDTAPGTPTPEVGEEETFALNGVIFAQLGESTTLKLRGIYSKEDDQDALFAVYHPEDWRALGAQGEIITLDSGALFLDGKVNKPLREGIQGVDIRNPTNADPLDGGYNRERFFTSLILEHDFDSGYELSYRGSYLYNDYQANVDFAHRPAVGTDPVFGTVTDADRCFFCLSIPFPFQEEFEETSHQLRLLSPGEDRFRWSAGGYYYWSSDQQFQANSDRAPIPGNPDQKTRGEERIINTAVFGSVAYDLSEQLTASFEGRLQQEKVQLDQLLSGIQASAIPDRDLREKSTSFEPRATLEYRPSDDQLFYALFAKGVKSGRFNTSTTLQFPEGDERRGVVRPGDAFIFAPPEKLFNYEIGSKTTFWDGRATLNIAAFYQDVKDQQLRQSVQSDEDANGDGSPDVLNVIFTAGDSRIYGFEMEAQAALTDALFVSAGLGFNDHQFKDDIAPSSDFDLFDSTGERSLRGKTSVNVPKVTGNASATYTVPLSNELEWSLRGDVIYTGSKYVELANLAKIGSHIRSNLRTSIKSEDWTVSLFVNNVFDDDTADGAGLTGTFTCQFRRPQPGEATRNPSQRCIGLAPNRGREIGLNASVNF